MQLTAATRSRSVSARLTFGLVFGLACTSPETGDAARRKGWEVCVAAKIHMARTRAPPRSIADLITPNCSLPCPLEEVPKDPWSVPLDLSWDSKGTLVVRSCGPDRRCGSPDDVRIECEEQRRDGGS